jgi:ABC-type phosphate transport system permease subunit
LCAIGYELTTQSMQSIRQFGLEFWRTEIWDPVSGEFGALPVHLGHALLVGC